MAILSIEVLMKQHPLHIVYIEALHRAVPSERPDERHARVAARASEDAGRGDGAITEQIGCGRRDEAANEQQRQR